MNDTSTPFILLILFAGIAVLGKAADLLVDQVTSLSLRMGVPPVLVGATIVSLGTTLPEAVVSVLAAFSGEPEIALGNAVGSIICDTGLVLGIGCLIGPLPVDRRLVNRQGWLQLAAPLLLVLLCVPWGRLNEFPNFEGVLSQRSGFLLLGLLVVYLFGSFRSASRITSGTDSEASLEQSSLGAILGRIALLIVMILIVVFSSEILVSGASVLAKRLEIPDGVIAATLIAFGTSLPELVIVVTSVLKGKGELAIGNIVGADILNVLFVAGAAAAVTPEGLVASSDFFSLQFPAMIAVLITFRIALMLRKTENLPRRAGILLIGYYVAYLILAFRG